MLANDNDRNLLCSFFDGLGRRERYRRFNGAGSHAAHYANVDMSRSVVLGHFRAGHIVAIAELHPCGTTFDLAEAAACCTASIERWAVFRELVAALAAEARHRGCAALVIEKRGEDPAFLALLMRLGDLAYDDEDVVKVVLAAQ